ncbi:hypothetical protein K9L67_02350 [Candidatus Woesearchaeota archaeon]|nr:hypothetical protein [Candidatus Woesearchaeota archaeon]MCF7901046.1 hypothetical protein [Candidatus Woesearchaeota archaeon]MCF8013373.1 hypothetical protein [Candidatus Woesearchaeota archaeon]
MSLLLFSVVFSLELVKFNLFFLIELFFIVLFFSLLPDIDSKKSYGSLMLHLFFILSIVLFALEILAFWKNLGLLIIFGALEAYHILFSKKGKNHRKFPHKLIFGLIISVLIGIILGNLWIFIFGFISFISHLIIDKLW